MAPRLGRRRVGTEEGRPDLSDCFVQFVDGGLKAGPDGGIVDQREGRVQRQPHSVNPFDHLVLQTVGQLLALGEPLQQTGLFLGAPALGLVPGQLGEAVELAVIVNERGEEDVGPESRPVLPLPPPLVPDPTLQPGLVQERLRLAGRGVVGQEKEGAEQEPGEAGVRGKGLLALGRLPWPSVRSVVRRTGRRP